MYEHPNLVEIDKYLVFHEPLIKGTGICGLAGDYHDPSKGTTLILSKDRSFRVEWHEGAHSFLSQITLLGLIANTLTYSIHFLLKEIQFSQGNIDDIKMKSSVTMRLIAIRERILQNFLVIHEMFALFTEKRGILGQSFFDSMDNFDRLYEHTSKALTLSDAKFLTKGRNEHKKAFDYICKFEKEYGHLRYAGDAAEFIVHLLPTVITNVNPKDLMYGSADVAVRAISNPHFVLQKLLSEIPKWAPDSSIHRTPDFLDLIIKSINKQSKYNDIFKNMKKFGDWFSDYINIIPLSEQFKDMFKALLSLHLKYFYFPMAIKNERLRRHVNFVELDKETWVEQKRTLEEHAKGDVKQQVTGIFSEGKENLIYDPLSIPPPVTLISDKKDLTLVVRSDLYNPLGLNHLLYSFTELVVMETSINPSLVDDQSELSYPILCFSDLCETKTYQCEKGYGKCMLPQKMINLVKHVKNTSWIDIDPLLICCKDRIAKFAKVSQFKKCFDKPITAPFRIKKTSPKLYGTKMKY